MTRSEMLKAIETELKNWEDCKLDEDAAKAVLKVVEENGMLPPTICYDSVGEYVNITSTDILYDNDISFSWEPEDKDVE